MDAEPEHAAAVFVVSAWLEPSNHPPVRARVTYTTAASGGMHTVAATASADDACRLLREWWETVSSEG